MRTCKNIVNGKECGLIIENDYKHFNRCPACLMECNWNEGFSIKSVNANKSHDSFVNQLIFYKE